MPAYKWLSPELAQDHTDEILGLGGRKLGTKPADTATRLRIPPNRQIVLPRPYLTAREALDFIRPFMVSFRPPWSLMTLSSYGFVQADGHGIWEARYRYGESGDVVRAVLREGGRLVFVGDSVPARAVGYLPSGLNLPDEWLDSSIIAAIVGRLPVPNGLVQPRLGMMRLSSFRDPGLVWHASFSADQSSKGEFVSWNVFVDAVTGEVLWEDLNRKVGYAIIATRRRIKGGEWENLPDPE